jgi:phosphatidate phosphatase APP1
MGWKISGALTLLALLTAAAQAGGDAITLYPAFAAAGVDASGTVPGAVIEGRIVEAHRSGDPGKSDGRATNMLRSLRQLHADEREHQPITLRLGSRELRTTSDEEGRFGVAIDNARELSAGWLTVTAQRRRSQASGSLLLVPPQNQHGLISDLDDTILVTDVAKLSSMLSNTLLKNPAQRAAVPGMAQLYSRAMAANAVPAAAPMFYLSASPRQLQGSIQRFLDLNAFPRGVLITRIISDDGGGEPVFDLVAYKTRRIEDIFARLPGVRFVLVGDDVQSDPEIYEQLRQRHPDRVEAVWIRRVSRDPKRAPIAGQRDVAELLR